MRTWKPCLTPAALAAVLLLTGCATTDDPSKGGLVSYWVHGEDAYEKRQEERDALLEQARARSAAAEAETAELERQVEQQKAELAEQEARLQRLRDDLAGFERECASMDARSEAAREEQERLQRDLSGLRREMQSLADVDADARVEVGEEIRDRQKYIAELERELKALRERASLLTTL